MLERTFGDVEARNAMIRQRELAGAVIDKQAKHGLVSYPELRKHVGRARNPQPIIRIRNPHPKPRDADPELALETGEAGPPPHQQGPQDQH